MFAADGSVAPHALVSDRDFVAFPCVSPGGSRIAWTAWDLPSMPFTSTELWTAELRVDGTLGSPQRVAGGSDESIFQPSWSPAGELYYVSDRNGWWNLFRLRDGRHEAVSPMAAEQGWPQWFCSLASYAFLSTGQIACLVNRGAEQRLVLVDPESGALDEPDIPVTACGLPSLRAHGSRVVFVGASDTDAPAVISWDAVSRQYEVLQRSVEPIAADRISRGRAIEFATRDGSVGKATFYPPVNPDVVPPDDELPPVVVLAHGGPTDQAARGLRLDVQVYTSRGIAVLAVDYGGSTGYGRAYADRLRGRWGVVDAEDCVAAALHLAALGDVDQARMLIAGGSAGGYIVLCALAFHDTFIGGISSYGISDLEMWASGTHKFESGYTNWLVGPIEDAAEMYRQRSPLQHAEQITSPLLLLQGLDDHVVPPDQAEEIVAALHATGTYYQYLALAGEGHGFRAAANIESAWDAQLAFVARVLGLNEPE
jgi:dipeptidyl aminopeptidase/acylaminoacyl peptidase